MCVCVCLGVLLREPGAGRETTLIAPAVHACPTVWFLVGNGGMCYGDYYWGTYRDYYRDPSPPSLLSTREASELGGRCSCSTHIWEQPASKSYSTCEGLNTEHLRNPQLQVEMALLAFHVYIYAEVHMCISFFDACRKSYRLIHPCTERHVREWVNTYIGIDICIQICFIKFMYIQTCMCVRLHSYSGCLSGWVSLVRI